MSKTTILIVEDEAIIAADLAGKLRQLGYEVAGTAAVGKEAVELACRLLPRVVLMDIRLKGSMDGIEAAEAIRRRVDIPVIYLTAHSDSATLTRAMVSEPFGYILKPFEERELATTIEMALYKHQSDRQLRKANDELEQRVRERTQELKELNETLERRIIERTAQLNAANETLLISRRAALNVAEDALAVRQQVEEMNGELRREIAERKRAEVEILKHVDALERFNKAAVDRELRMGQLKKEVTELLARVGAPSRYSLDFERQATGALPPDPERAAGSGESGVKARTLRLLLIEDSEDDALIEIEELRKGGFDPVYTRVYTPKALEAALENDAWDAVIADYNLPSFTGIDALRIVQAKGMDVPLLLVSGAVGEELAVSVMKAGFHDFLIKGNLSRLAQVLERELREAGVRRERLATLNLMEDAIIARREADETSDRLRFEILERNHAEEALRQSEAQLQVMNEDLERKVEQRTQELQEKQLQYLHAEKLSAIGRLSASIAHEFNNPLQGIMAILKGLKKRAILEEEDKKLLDAAIDESVRIKNLIRSLQDFNRPSAGKKVLMDVQKSIDSLLLLSKSDFKRKRLSVAVNYAERLPHIFAVPDQIKQVFLNLLTNAADACIQPGGVITISSWQQENSVAVAIKDTGIGINSEIVDLIFQPFYTTKPEVKGTGLGLSICHGIVQSHQGEIRVDSQPGQGATFTVLLPIKGT
jgi:signal transduction histidine kinase/AmiR/NasT family two-component response regulator